MVQWLCIRNPADTTSEPLTGNGQTGAPVKAPMSDGFFAVTRVEPWNTDVSHPCFVRGWEFFIPSPRKSAECIVLSAE